MDEKKYVQEALNRSLSGLQENPYLAQRVIAKAKGETKMKRKSIGALALVLALALGLVGTGYALFSSRVAEIFAGFYGQERGDWLQAGKIAQLNDTVTIGDVTISLDEVVYRSRGLYGVGTVRAVKENDVLLPYDLGEDGEAWFMQTNEENEYAVLAHQLAEQAASSGGRMLAVNVIPRQVGVDNGTMLNCASIGYYDERNEDGSLTFSFEVEDGSALEDGTTYQMHMEACVWQVGADGKVMQDTMQQKEWMLAFKPVVMVDPTPAAAQEETAAATEIPGAYALIAPSAYTENGTMPVYGAEASAIDQRIDPAWFNQSGIAEERGEGSLVFTDHAELQYRADYVYYEQETDEQYDFARDGGEPIMESVPDLSWFICSMASETRFYPYAQNEKLEHEQLTYLSLQEAQETAEALFAKLGLRGYACSDALDMSVERIHSLGEAYNRYWYEGDACTNLPRMDYSKATAEDEGYYLVYTLQGTPMVSDMQNLITLFVDRGGIAFLNLRNMFTMGEAAETPDALVTPDEAIAAVNREACTSAYGKPVRSVEKVILLYRPVRAEDKADGMVFAPVWRVEYKDDDSAAQDYCCWAEVNAVSGKLINAIFQ